MAGSVAPGSRGAPSVRALYASLEYGPVPEGTGAAQRSRQPREMCSPSSFPGPKPAATERPKAPRTRAAPWSHRETLDFLALWGEEGIQEQLRRCHRNADVYQWISERMARRGYSRDEDQCRTKGKDLKKSYKQARLHGDGPARQRCRFFAELDAILGGGNRGSGGGGGGEAAPPWCQVVIKEESDPELRLDPDRGLPPGYDYAWAQVSATDGSDLEPPGGAPSALARASSSSSSSQAPGGVLPQPEGAAAAPILFRPRAASSSGGFVKEETTSPSGGEGEEPGGRDAAGGAAAPYLCAPEREEDGEEEPRPRRETRAHLDAPWRPPGLNRRAFPRPRTLPSTREKLAQLRNRRKRPRDDKFDELVRDIRTHFREREKLFQSLWEEEKAQRERDRRLWAAEMDWIRQMWAKSQKERDAMAGEEKTGPRLVKEESWNFCKDLDGDPPEDKACVQEPPLLKVESSPLAESPEF